MPKIKFLQPLDFGQNLTRSQLHAVLFRSTIRLLYASIGEVKKSEVAKYHTLILSVFRKLVVSQVSFGGNTAGRITDAIYETVLKDPISVSNLENPSPVLILAIEIDRVAGSSVAAGYVSNYRENAVEWLTDVGKICDRIDEPSLMRGIASDFALIQDGATGSKLLGTEIQDLPEETRNAGSIIGVVVSDYDFRFWRRWQDVITLGNVLSSTASEKIALLPDFEWKQGAAHLARQVEQIEFSEIAVSKVFSPNFLVGSGEEKLSVGATGIEDLGVYHSTLKHVEDALEDLLSAKRNWINDRSLPVVILHRAIRKHSKTPYRVYQDFLVAYDIIQEEMKRGELPTDSALVQVVHALRISASNIRRAIPEVDRLVSNQVAMRVDRATPTEKEKFLRAMDLFETVADASLSAEIAEDAAIVRRNENEDLTRGALSRLVGRIGGAVKSISTVSPEARLRLVVTTIAAASAAFVISLLGL